MKEIKEQKTIYVTKYQAFDGTVFEYRRDCEDYDSPALKAHSFRGGMKTRTDASRYII